MMNKKLLLAGFWTMSMVCVCQGAEAEKTYQDLAKQRVTIKGNATDATMSKLTKLWQLAEEVGDTLKYVKNVKERRALSALQHRLESDQQLIQDQATGAY